MSEWGFWVLRCVCDGVMVGREGMGGGGRERERDR